MIEREPASRHIPLCLGARSSATLLVLFAALGLPQAAQAIEKFSCTEHWFDTTKEGAWVSQQQPDRIQTCTAKKNDKPAQETGYRFVNGLFYQYATYRKRSSPCTGNGVGNMGQMLDPVCWMPSKLQVHRTGVVRTFWLATARQPPSAQPHRCKRCAPLMTQNAIEMDIPELAVSDHADE